MITSKNKNVTPLLFTLALVFGILPTPALATLGNELGIEATATLEDYYIVQAVADGVNAEYGTSIRFTPYSEYEARGMQMPKAPTPEGLVYFREMLSEQAEESETMSLEAQLLVIDAYLNATEDSYPKMDVPSHYCTNASVWGVNKMIEIICREGYGDDVVQYVADRNPVFAATMYGSTDNVQKVL